MKLRISDELSLPADFITQPAAALGVRGSGKSNTAAVIVEELFRAGLPFCVVDPTSTWWGLRSSRAGGPGLSIPIFGGPKGDVPLEKGSGETIADLIAEERLSCVIDVGEFSEGEKTRWLADFAERLYRKNRDPLHLVLEEADDYVPQKPFREQARTLRAFQNIVRRGRARGLGITMITQRSAVISKDVLTQAETLFVMRTTSPQDRKAVQAWVDYHGQSREVVDSLPSLKSGECWVWSPHYLGVMKRVQVRRRETFDSAATPKDVKGRRPPATLADVDLEAVKTRMASAIERAKADDPKELRRRIAELERELRKRPAAEPERVEVPVLSEAEREDLEELTSCISAATGALELLDERQKEIRGEAAAILEPARSLVDKLSRLNGGPHGEAYRRGLSPAPRRIPAAPGRSDGRGDRPTERPRPVSADVAEGLTGPERRILDAIAWFEAIGIEEPTQVGVAFLAGYTIGGGAWNNPRGRLHTKGLVEYRGERIRLTDGGRNLANHPEAPLTAEELQARVMDRIDGPMRRILTPLLQAYPKGMTNEDLAAAAGYSPGGGAYNNPRGRLRTLGLIEYDAGLVRAAPLLFLEET